MSQAPYGPLPPDPGAAPPWPPAPGGPARNASRALGILGVALGLLGLIAGVSAWFRPMPKVEASAPVYSEQEVAEAKDAVCGAYSQFNKVIAATSRRNLGEDAPEKLLVAVNVRLGLYVGGDHLTRSVDANPAAPAGLRERAKAIAAIYQEIAMKQLAEFPVSDLNPLADKAKSVGKEIDSACL